MRDEQADRFLHASRIRHSRTAPLHIGFTVGLGGIHTNALIPLAEP